MIIMIMIIITTIYRYIYIYIYILIYSLIYLSTYLLCMCVYVYIYIYYIHISHRTILPEQYGGHQQSAFVLVLDRVVEKRIGSSSKIGCVQIAYKND